MKSMEEKGRINLPFVDMSSPDIASTANSIRQACTEYGFFYLINHGIDDELLRQVFDESRKFFELPLEEKMKLERNDGHRGYTPPFAETLDTSPGYRGDLKESFYIGPMGVENSSSDSLNQWPSEEGFPFWRETMVTYYEKILTVGRRLAALIALSLKVDEDFFDKVGALQPPMAFLRLLHYPILGTDQLTSSDNVLYGASAHSDYGMVTLLITDGVPGLQICREKDTHAQIWEDVQHVDGALIVNVGDMLERWTNCFFRSTLHRVMAIGQERFSVAFFLDPNSDCLVECLETCINESNPPRFPPIRSGDHLRERLRITYGSK